MTQTLYRAVAEQLERTGPDTVAGLIVPWNREADIVEMTIDGKLDRYREAFAPGAFDAQTRSENTGTIRKVQLLDSHAPGQPGPRVGYALGFENREDGQWAEMRVMPRFRDDIAQLIDDGVDGLSVGFHPKRGGTVVTAAGVRVRTDAHLEHVALVAEPAYDDARVLAMRAQAEAADIDAEARQIAAQILAGADRWSAHRGGVR